MSVLCICVSCPILSSVYVIPFLLCIYVFWRDLSLFALKITNSSPLICPGNLSFVSEYTRNGCNFFPSQSESSFPYLHSQSESFLSILQSQCFLSLSFTPKVRAFYPFFISKVRVLSLIFIPNVWVLYLFFIPKLWFLSPFFIPNLWVLSPFFIPIFINWTTITKVLTKPSSNHYRPSLDTGTSASVLHLVHRGASLAASSVHVTASISRTKWRVLFPAKTRRREGVSRWHLIGMSLSRHRIPGVQR